MIYFGIDPGLNGAVAIMTDASLIKVIDTPIEITYVPSKRSKSGKKIKKNYIEEEMAKILRMYAHETTSICIERQWARSKEGVSSVFTTGFGFGLWIGMITALGLPCHQITPMQWKKSLMPDMGKEKSESCIRVQQLYPDAEVFTPRGRAIDGRADAILIAHYLKQTTNPI